jgi:hypothetical protein
MFPEEVRNKYGGEYTEENFDKYCMAEYYSGQEDFLPDEKNCYVIDNNEYGEAGIKHLREIIGLSGEFTYDVKALEDVQQKRYAEMNMEMIQEEVGKVNAAAAEEKKE